MNRRDAIKKTAFFLGAALSSSALAGVMNGCRPEAIPSSEAWKPSVLSEEEIEITKALIDLILPATDTPSASELGVHRFIDQMLKEYYLPEEKELFVAGLEKMNSGARLAHGLPFPACKPEQQQSMLASAAREAEYARKRSAGEEKPDQPFFLALKELTLLGYFSTETGASEVMAFDVLPGGYQGCVGLEELGGKTWVL